MDTNVMSALECILEGSVTDQVPLMELQLQLKRHPPIFSKNPGLCNCIQGRKASERYDKECACAEQPVLGQTSLASGTGPEPLLNQGFSWNQELLAGSNLM